MKFSIEMWMIECGHARSKIYFISIQTISINFWNIIYNDYRRKFSREKKPRVIFLFSHSSMTILLIRHVLLHTDSYSHKYFYFYQLLCVSREHNLKKKHKSRAFWTRLLIIFFVYRFGFKKFQLFIFWISLSVYSFEEKNT